MFLGFLKLFENRVAQIMAKILSNFEEGGEATQGAVTGRSWRAQVESRALAAVDAVARRG